MTWFHFIIAAFARNFVLDHILGVWDQNGSPGCVQHTRFQTHSRLNFISFVPFFLWRKLLGSKNIFSVAEKPMKWEAPCKYFVCS